LVAHLAQGQVVVNFMRGASLKDGSAGHEVLHQLLDPDNFVAALDADSAPESRRC
jgi:hypothetical protein